MTTARFTEHKIARKKPISRNRAEVLSPEATAWCWSDMRNTCSTVFICMKSRWHRSTPCIRDIRLELFRCITV